MSALIPLELLKFCNFNNKDVDKIVLDSVTIWEKTPCTILILGDNCAVSEEQFTVECSDSFVNSFPFYWSIIEGEQYVSINDSGLVTVNEDTPYSIVTIKATSSINSNLYATKTIRVQYAILSVDSSDPSFYTYIKGTPGSSGYNEGPENLFDGTTTTKWCMPDIGSGIYVIFGVETPLVLSGYSWAAGNDSTNGGRNPKSWKWYGSNADSSLLFLDNKWELLEDVVDNIKMLNTNYAWTSYTIDNPVRKKFKYFKLAISKKSSNTTGNYFQISELRVEGMIELIELLEEIKIIGPSEVENSALFEVEYLPSKTAYKDVIWEIVEGGDKVSISNTGKLNAKELIENFSVTIKVSSTYNSSIYDLKLVFVTFSLDTILLEVQNTYNLTITDISNISSNTELINKYKETDLGVLAICALYPDFITLCLDNIVDSKTPKLATYAELDEERKWFIRSNYGYTDWYLISNILSLTDWKYLLGGFTPTSNYVSKVGTTSYSTGTLFKFFCPESLPTGYWEHFADYIDVRVNGTLIFSSSSWHSSNVSHTYDFSNIIKVNEVNFVVIEWYGSGNHGVDFGFIY